jgi:transposase
MGKRIQVAGHLTVEQLKDQYQHETDGRTRTHWQILWQIAAGKTAQEVAELTGLTVDWVREVVKRYNQQGPDAVGDQRHANRGAPRVINSQQEAELVTALQGPAPDGGLWSGPKVARWINARAKRQVTNDGGLVYLRRLDFRQQVPRQRHAKADPEAQLALKKT